MPSSRPFSVVDIHNHVISDDLARFPIAPLGGQQSEWSRTRPANADAMLAAMESAGVAQSVLVQASTCYGLDNRYVASCVQAHPKHFAGVYSADLSSDDAVERLRHWTEAGLAGARVFVAGHTTADHTVRLDDTRADAAWEHLARHHIPVSVQLRSDKLGQLDAVLARHPDATVILDHCARPALEDGPPYAQAQALWALARHPNLHVKYTTHNVRESALGQATPASFAQALVQHFGARRIAWGSNFPASSGSMSEQLQEALDATAALDIADQAWIFGGTARALYPSLNAR